MDKPLTSIILPSLRPSQLARCLASIERYTETIDYEVVVISPFDIEPHPNVVHVKETGAEGLYQAVASGYERAKGEYIIHIPDDSRATPLWAANMIAFMRPHDDEIFEGNFRHFDAKGERPEPGIYSRLYAPFFCIRRDKADRIGGLMDCYYKRFWGDPDLSLRVWHNGGRVETCPNTWVYHAECSDEIHESSYKSYFIRDRDAFIQRWHHIYAQPDESFGGSQPVKTIMKPLSSQLPPEECAKLYISMQRRDWKTISKVLMSEDTDACLYPEGLPILYNSAVEMLCSPLSPKKTLYSILEWLRENGYVPSEFDVKLEDLSIRRWALNSAVDITLAVISATMGPIQSVYRTKRSQLFKALKKVVGTQRCELLKRWFCRSRTNQPEHFRGITVEQELGSSKPKDLQLGDKTANRQIQCIDYVYQGDYAYTALHPFYKNIMLFPPEGYEFTSTPNSYTSFNVRELAGEIASGKFDKVPAKFRDFFSAFLDECKKNKITTEQLFEFLQSRPLDRIFTIPSSAGLVFVPTYPFYMAANNWIMMIEDYTTLLYPFVHNGFTYDLDIRSVPCFKIIKSLFSLKNCKGIITHVNNTYDTLKTLFDTEEIRNKVKYVPIGFPIPSIEKKKNISKDRIDLLYISSYHGGASHFFVRGGREILAAFRIIAERYPNVYLTIHSPLPWKSLSRLEKRLIKNHPRLEYSENHIEDNEFQDLLYRSDIFLIPAFRLHSISTVQALSYGLPVICSDGWGFSEFVQDGITGFLAKGQYGRHSWIDSDGILREDYRGATMNQTLVAELVDKTSILAEDVDLLREMSGNARNYALKDFSIKARNRKLKDIFDDSYGVQN